MKRLCWLVLLCCLSSPASAEKIAVFSGTTLYTAAGKPAFTLPKKKIYQATVGASRRINGRDHVEVHLSGRDRGCYTVLGRGYSSTTRAPVYVPRTKLRAVLNQPTTVTRGSDSITVMGGVDPTRIPRLPKGFSLPKFSGSTSRVVAQASLTPTKRESIVVFSSGAYKTHLGVLTVPDDGNTGYQVSSNGTVEIIRDCWRVRVRLPGSAIDKKLTKRLRERLNSKGDGAEAWGFGESDGNYRIKRGSKLYWFNGSYAGKATKDFRVRGIERAPDRMCFVSVYAAENNSGELCIKLGRPASAFGTSGFGDAPTRAEFRYGSTPE